MKFNLGIGLICLAPTVFSQDKFNIVESINKFSVNLLSEVSNEGGNKINVALSPLTIWTILTVISEGAFNDTASQLNRALEQPLDKRSVREYYKKINSMLHRKTSPDTDFETTTGIFTRSEFPVKDKFATNAKEYYGANITPVDFQSNSEKAAEIINQYVAKATRNRIPVLVNAADVRNAYIMVTSTLYFKGQWEMPFNVSATQRRAFLDDNKNEIGYVQMMYQARPFPYARIDNLKADALELPYGNDGSFSMLLLVPRGAQTLSKMLHSFKGISVTDILTKTAANHVTFPEDDIHVYLPKFKVTSDFNMDRPLKRMGIVDVFDPQRANLLGIFPHYLYLSRVIQKAEIEVDEEGTVASAAGGAIFINRAPPPTVTANRPFVFLIIDKRIGSIVFAGKISNPNTLRQ